MSKVKNMGHYEGTILSIDDEGFQKLEASHQILLNLSLKKAKLEQELKEVNDAIKLTESGLIDKANDESVDWIWNYQITRSNVSWKAEFIKAVGQKEADKILKDAPKSITEKIGIKYRDVQPDSIIQIKSNNPKPAKRIQLKRK